MIIFFSFQEDDEKQGESQAQTKCFLSSKCLLLGIPGGVALTIGQWCPEGRGLAMQRLSQGPRTRSSQQNACSRSSVPGRLRARSEAGANRERGRREVLQGATAAASAFSLVTDPALGAKTPQVQVGEGESITEAIFRAPPGATVRVPAGKFVEPIIVNKPVTLRGTKKMTMIRWNGGRPGLTVKGRGNVLIRDVTVSHTADGSYEQNGSAVAVEPGGKLEMEGEATYFLHLRCFLSVFCLLINKSWSLIWHAGCELTSTTGNGATGKGGSMQLRECRLVSSKLHGVQYMNGTEGRIEGCLVQKNGQNGGQVEDDSPVGVFANTFAENGGYGLDCVNNFLGISIRENSVYGNKKGSFHFASDVSDKVLITSDNNFDTNFVVG